MQPETPASTELQLSATSPRPTMVQRSHVDEITTQLQRRLATEAGDRDAAKISLQRLKCVVDSSRQRLLSLFVPPSAGVVSGEEKATLQRGRELVRELEVEVRSATQGNVVGLQGTSAAPSSPRRGANYEVLRSSLQTEQRRCESLNNDMMIQAEANDELVETLGTVKDANKRLLDQIRAETAEIAKLTQQRVDDEKRMDEMTRRHEADRDIMRQETQRQVLSVREAGAERHNQTYNKLSDQIRNVKARTERIRADTRHLQGDLQACKLDMVGLVDFTEKQLGSAERDFTSQCALLLSLHEQRRMAEEDAIGDLKLRLTAEREAAMNESMAWNHKYAALCTDKEAMEDRASRNIAQLSSRLQALERQADADRNGWAQDRAVLERQADEYPLQHAQRKSALDQLQREYVALDSSLSAVISESSCLEQTINELRRQSRETYDALAAAVSSNEHLRQQMQEQHTSFQDKNEAELCDCRNSYEQKLEDVKRAQDGNAAMTNRQVEAVEIDVRTQDEELDILQTQIESMLQDNSNLDRSVSTWRSQYETSASSREMAERKLQEEKHAFQHERVKLQATSDHNAAHIGALEEEIQLTSAELHDYRRTAAARETEYATRQAAAEALLKDLQEMLVDGQTRLREVLETQKRVLTDDSEYRERHLELQVLLEKNLEKQARLKEEESRRLLNTFSTQKRSSEQVRSEFQRERDSTTENLRRCQDEGRHRLAETERERTRIEEHCRTDFGQVSQAVSQWHRKSEVVERDLSRLNALLTESESNLAWVLQECTHEEREAALNTRQLEDEVRAQSTQLERMRFDEASLTQQLESARQRNEEEKRRLQRTLDSAGGRKFSPPRRNPPLTVR